MSYDLTQVVSSCTRESAILDLVFLSDGLLYSDCDVVEGISDHKAVIVHLDIALEPNKPTYSIVHDFSRADDNSIVTSLASHFDEFMFSSDALGVDLLVEMFQKIVKECIANFVPKNV